MVKAEWGTKRRCLSCTAVFYDLKKTPILCPKCGVEFHPEVILKSRRSRPEEKVVPKPVAAVVPVEEEEVLADDAEGADAELIEDASELGEDEDDVAEVIPGATDDEPGPGV